MKCRQCRRQVTCQRGIDTSGMKWIRTLKVGVGWLQDRQTVSAVHMCASHSRDVLTLGMARKELPGRVLLR